MKRMKFCGILVIWILILERKLLKDTENGTLNVLSDMMSKVVPVRRN